MCLPPISRGPSPGSRGKSPPPSSSSSTSSSSLGPPLPSRKHRRRNPNSASTESDLPSSRIVSDRGRPQPSPLRSSAPSRKTSARKSPRTSSVVGNSLPPSRRSSMKGARDSTRLAPGSPQTVPRSPAFSTKSEKPSRSPSKKQHTAQSTPRRKRSETPSAQTPTTTPRTPAVAFEKKEKKRSAGEIHGRDRIMTMKAPLQDGGIVSGLMVIRPESGRRSSESGSSRSKSSPRRSESRDEKKERPSSGNSSKATTLAAGPIGLGISLEDSRTPTPTSKAKVEKVREIEPKQSQVPRISVEAPSPVSKQPAFPLQPASVLAPEPPTINVTPPKATPVETYPIMATFVYPTKEELAYQPISRYQMTSNFTPTKTNQPSPQTPIIARAAGPTHAVPVSGSAPAAALHLPPSMLQYHNPFDTSPASSIHEISGGTPSLSQQSSESSLAIASSSSVASSSAIPIKEPEQATPIIQEIPHIVSATVSPSSSTTSLVSTSSSSTNQSFRSAAPRVPTPDVTVPELSDRKPNYYRYTAPQKAAPKRMKVLMDSPKPPATARRAGPWDGMPGADPNLGAYYRNAAAAKLREATKPPFSASEAKDTPVDGKNLAAYYLQVQVKRKLALERMKHEHSETDDETSASGISSLSEPWVDPNLPGYYRAAEAAKKKEITTKATLNTEKALTVSPTKEPLARVLAGRKVFFSGLRRSMPHPFHNAPPPPAPTPPLGGDATSPIGEGGPPEGAAESWFKANMAAGSGERKSTDFWTSSSESTLPGAGARGVKFPLTVPPPAPTPPLAREGPTAGQPSPGYYVRSPRTGYSYH